MIATYGTIIVLSSPRRASPSSRIFETGMGPHCQPIDRSVDSS